MVFIIDNKDNLWVAGNTNDDHQFTNTNIKAISVSCGSYHTAIIDENNYLWVTGDNKSGQLGLGHTNNVRKITNTNIKVISVSCGYYHTTIIDEDGYLWVTGSNKFGQLGLGHNNDVHQFTKIEDFIPKIPSNRFKKTKSARKID